MSAAARSAFLERACGDASVRAAVERLLRADAAADGFLGEPLVRIASAVPSPAALRPPARIGPYRLEEKLGEGGMGTVYRAVRDDEAFEREVAVKLIAYRAISDETRRRLRIERQVLAGLNHPWIAHGASVAAAATGITALILFALGMAAMAGRLSQERANLLTIRASLSLEQAELQEVVDFFRGFFEHAGPLVDERRDLTLREAVDQHARMIEAGLEDQPAVRVEIATVLDNIYRKLGHPARALDWSESALALQRHLVGESG